MSHGNGVIINNERIIVEHENHTGSSALAVSLAPGEPFQLLGFECHQGTIASTPQNMTLTKDGGAAADVYDTVVHTVAMATAGNDNIVENFDDEPVKCYHKDDEIDFAWTNGDGRTYGLTIFWRKLKG